MDILPGNMVRLRKKHPCGGDVWQVIKIGADIRIECCTCRRKVLLERGIFERRVKAVYQSGVMNADCGTSSYSTIKSPQPEIRSPDSC